MLDLMSFKKEFVTQCRSVLSESGPQDMKIEECKMKKAQRGELNGLLFRKEGLECAPTLYVEDFYKAYKDGSAIRDLSHAAIESVVSNLSMAETLAGRTGRMLDENIESSFADQEFLCVHLLNMSRNKEYLKDIAYREVGCGFVCIARIECDEYRLVITNDLINSTGINKDELFDKALLNTVKRYPAVLQDMIDVVRNGTDEPENLLDLPCTRAPAGAGPGFALTNSKFFWGAGALFYPGVIDRIHELLDGDFYVLPSSVHEMIIMKVEDQDPQQLADLIRSANRSVVEDDDILADDLYVCESGRLCRVSYGGVIPACGDKVC